MGKIQGNEKMNLTIIRNILTFALFFISSAYAASPHDASLEWKTLESEHFLIHFHQGEQAIAEILTKHLILRVSAVFSSYTNNFVKTVIKLAQTQPLEI